MVITLKSVYMDCLSNRSGNRRQQTKRLEAIFQIPLITSLGFLFGAGANVVFKKNSKNKGMKPKASEFSKELGIFC